MKIDSPNSKGISTGFGIPTGGTSNQVLVKNSSTNYDTSWGSATSEGLFEAFTGITEGYAVRLGEDGKIYPTDFVGVEDQPIIGIAQTSGATNSFVRVILEGGLSTLTSGLTPSYNYYADTNGSISLTGETYVGTALSGNTLQVSFGSPNGVITPSLNVIDNTITDPANITVPGRYIVPVSGTTGEFVGESNDYADYDGVGFTFTIPTNGDKALISTGPNSGNVYLFTSGMTSGWTLSSQSTTLPTSNWAIGIAYKQFDLVIYQGVLYQANNTIPANTAFTSGSSGATWTQIGLLNGQAEYGENYLTSNITVNNTQTTLLTANIPSAGVWNINYYADINWNSSNLNDEGRVWLADSTGTIIVGSGSYGYISSNANMGAVYANQITLTTTSATTITLRGIRTSSSPMIAMGTLNVGTISSVIEPAGTKISWNKIAGFLPASTKSFSSPVTIGATTTAPTKGTVLQDYITIQDDGSGWCTCEYSFYQSVASGSAGSGVYLFTLPGSYQFDTSVHQVWTTIADYGATNAIRYIIPGSNGIVGNATSMANSVAFAYSATQFRISLGGEQIYGTPTIRTNITSVSFGLTNNTLTYNGSFRFKKSV